MTKQIHIIDAKEIGEDIANDLLQENIDNWDNITIDNVTTEATYALHDSVKADIIYYACKIIEDKLGYEL